MVFSLTETLPVIWYFILSVAVFAYALGDGFDLGFGVIYPLARGEQERRFLLNSIGPVWDGNEVWLIIVVGGLFAGFPPAYTLLLTIFYMPVWTLVMIFILRGCSLEFRSKVEAPAWKFFWDTVFVVSSIALSFFLGTFAGNIVLGLPIAPDTSYSSVSWLLFFRPYAVLCGAVLTSAFAVHGACFALMKTSGELHTRIKHRFPFILSALFVCYFLLLVASIGTMSERFDSFPTYPLFILLIAFTCCFCVAAKTSVKQERYGLAFLYSTLNLLMLILAAILMTFPNILLSTIDSQYSCTIYNTVVNIKTLKSLCGIILVGLPLIITYGVFVYRVFRGKTNFPSIY
ncbi:cytochrome d ubiquinol oxidase subunit II [Chlamydia sp. 17-3921]|uniref:cytochrome d ubiquinol oxidase subunit II n=1 Tax=Chlamydia sp. 17-3921 TaxID=2675798 RepID=UPI00191AA076|nr:cytochrome d ubiquinol oxidase subunit II [Chlamydia sp. 17-3921]